MTAKGLPAAGGADDFLLAVLHDMRAHLRKSITRAQRLSAPSQTLLTPELQDHVDEILAAGRDMDLLLGRLAKYAVAGRDPNDKPPSSIEVMFNSAFSRLTSRNANSEIDWRHYRASDVQAPSSFEVVLTELLDNALKFRIGTVKITLTVEELPEKTVFGVADTGIGFEPQYYEKIMKPLERLHPVSVYPGPGLGLSICQRMVEAWGGKLWAESTLGGGSTFWFTVPA